MIPRLPRIHELATSLPDNKSNNSSMAASSSSSTGDSFLSKQSGNIGGQSHITSVQHISKGATSFSTPSPLSTKGHRPHSIAIGSYSRPEDGIHGWPRYVANEPSQYYDVKSRRPLSPLKIENIQNDEHIPQRHHSAYGESSIGNEVATTHNSENQSNQHLRPIYRPLGQEHFQEPAKSHFPETSESPIDTHTMDQHNFSQGRDKAPFQNKDLSHERTSYYGSANTIHHRPLTTHEPTHRYSSYESYSVKGDPEMLSQASPSMSFSLMSASSTTPVSTTHPASAPDSIANAYPTSSVDSPRLNQFRLSHKIAERRRRREMKSLFDSLRACLPIESGIRLSKWETLTKAIGLIKYQNDEINRLRNRLQYMSDQMHYHPSQSQPQPPPHIPYSKTQ